MCASLGVLQGFSSLLGLLLGGFCGEEGFLRGVLMCWSGDFESGHYGMLFGWFFVVVSSIAACDREVHVAVLFLICFFVLDIFEA